MVAFETDAEETKVTHEQLQKDLQQAMDDDDVDSEGEGDDVVPPMLFHVRPRMSVAAGVGDETPFTMASKSFHIPEVKYASVLSSSALAAHPQ